MLLFVVVTPCFQRYDDDTMRKPIRRERILVLFKNKTNKNVFYFFKKRLALIWSVLISILFLFVKSINQDKVNQLFIELTIRLKLSKKIAGIYTGSSFFYSAKGYIDVNGFTRKELNDFTLPDKTDGNPATVCMILNRDIYNYFVLFRDFNFFFKGLNCVSFGPFAHPCFILKNDSFKPTNTSCTGCFQIATRKTPDESVALAYEVRDLQCITIQRRDGVSTTSARIVTATTNGVTSSSSSSSTIDRSNNTMNAGSDRTTALTSNDNNLVAIVGGVSAVAEC